MQPRPWRAAIAYAVLCHEAGDAETVERLAECMSVNAVNGDLSALCEILFWQSIEGEGPDLYADPETPGLADLLAEVQRTPLPLSS